MVRRAGGIGFDPIADLNELHFAAPFRESHERDNRPVCRCTGSLLRISSVPVSQAVLRFVSHWRQATTHS